MYQTERLRMFHDAELGCRQGLRLATDSGSCWAVIVGHVGATRQPNASALTSATNVRRAENKGGQRRLDGPNGGIGDIHTAGEVGAAWG